MTELMEILEELRPDIDFETETQLVTGGLLESFDIVTLVTQINEAFDIEIKTHHLVPKNFDSAQAMLALIEQLSDD